MLEQTAIFVAGWSTPTRRWLALPRWAREKIERDQARGRTGGGVSRLAAFFQFEMRRPKPRNQEGRTDGIGQIINSL